VADLVTRLQGDLNAARRAQDKPAVLLLGSIIADVRNAEIALGRAITDADVVEVMRRGIKRRREAIEMYDAGARAELAQQERIEVGLLERYLPAAPADEEIREAIRQAIAGGASNVGAVMGKVMPQFKGRAEGGQINAIAREELAKQG